MPLTTALSTAPPNEFGHHVDNRPVNLTPSQCTALSKDQEQCRLLNMERHPSEERGYPIILNEGQCNALKNAGESVSWVRNCENNEGH